MYVFNSEKRGGFRGRRSEETTEGMRTIEIESGRRLTEEEGEEVLLLLYSMEFEGEGRGHLWPLE